jgi:hypothetical protein
MNHPHPLLFALAASFVVAAARTQAPLDVHVLDAETGKTAAHATVYAIGLDDPSRQVARDPFEPVFDRLVRCGKPFRTDAAGTVVLPPDLLPVELAVRAEGRFAWAEVPWPLPERLVLALVREQSIAVRITDAGGKPAKATANAWRLLPNGNTAGHVSLRPEANGVATLQLAAMHCIRNPFGNDGRCDEAIVALRLAVVAEDAPHAEFALAAAPTELPLTAPECGLVEVTVLDDAGQPRRDGWVHLAPAKYTPHSHAESVAIVDGKARFTAVAVSTRLTASTSLGLRRGTEVEFDGPKAVGETIAITLRGTRPRGDDRPVVTLRGSILDASKRPVGNAAVCIGVLRNGNMLDGVQPRCATATDGTFTCELLGPLASADELVVATASTPMPIPLFDQVALVRVETPANRLDLGNLQPKPAPLLCDVRAVDGAGKPVVGSMHVGPADTSPLLPLPGSNLQSDRHGRVRAFAVIAREQLLAVQVWTPGAPTPPHHCTTGRAHTVTVPTTHRVPGSVQLAAARQAQHLTAQLVDAKTYGQPTCGFGAPRPTPVPIAPDGSFVAGPVAAGTFHLQVLLHDAFEVALVENVVVGDAGIGDADRLRRIDLGGALREITVQIDRSGLADDVVGDVQLAPFGEPVPGKITRTNVQAAFRRRPLTLLVPSQGEWTLRTEVAGQHGPSVRIDGPQVRLATR